MESFRPGVMDRLGVGYDALASATAVIYCPISGYGQDGPLTARSGPTRTTSRSRPARPDRPPWRPAGQSAGQIADLGGGGLMAAVGILAALHERERSGEGQVVDVSR